MAELRATMTVEEEAGWVEYHSLLAEERKRALDEAKAGARGGRGGRR